VQAPTKYELALNLQTARRAAWYDRGFGLGGGVGE